MAGVKGIPVVFLLSDTQIVDESFLESINGLINSGEVPHLFDKAEYEKVIFQVSTQRSKMTGSAHQIFCSLSQLQRLAPASAVSKEDVWNYFLELVRANLHIVLCMSPLGGTFRERTRMFPALLHATVDWFQEWPTEALHSVATTMLRDADSHLLGSSSEKMKDSIAKNLVFIHNQVEILSHQFTQKLRRTNYVTPTLFIHLVKNYLAILAAHRKEIAEKLDRLDKGLKTVISGNDVVTQMKIELQKLQPVLEQAIQDAEELSAQVIS